MARPADPASTESFNDLLTGGHTPADDSTDAQVVSSHDASGHDGPAFGRGADMEAAADATPLGNSPSRERALDTTLVPVSGDTTTIPRDADQRLAAIRQAAFRRYEARQGAEGSAEQDWLDAEAEVDRN